MTTKRKLYKRSGRRWLTASPSLTAVGWSVTERDINFPQAQLGIYNYGEQVRLHSGNTTVAGMQEYKEKLLSLRRVISAFLLQLQYACSVDEPERLVSRTWLNDHTGLNAQYTGSVCYYIDCDSYRFEFADCTAKISFKGLLQHDTKQRRKDERKLEIIMATISKLIDEVSHLIELGLCSDQPHKLEPLNK